MLKQRIITASILFVLFLAALFGLPALGWQALVLVVMWQGAVEWARLSGLSGRAATSYWLLTLAMMAGMEAEGSMRGEYWVPNKAYCWLVTLRPES